MSESNYIEKLIVRYFLEEINEEELRELETWIAESSENKTYFFQLKKISDSSRRAVWSEAEKDESWQRMYAKLAIDSKQKELQLPVSRTLRPLSWFRYAAVILIALVSGWGINEFISDRGEGMQVLVEPEYNEIKVERGGRGNTLVLSDGSKVILNAATTFRYPTDFSSTNRTVYLDGEAYFDVEKDETKPFIVKLKKQDVTVLGTSFNVEAYNDESHSIVTLLSGSISLESYDENGNPVSKMFLKPNQRVVSDNQSGSVSLENMDPSFVDGWTRGKYKFKDEPMQAIAKRLEKYYDLQIHIEDETLGKMKYTGTFSQDQDIQDILRVLDNEKRYRVKQMGKEIFIVKR